MVYPVVYRYKQIPCRRIPEKSAHMGRTTDLLRSVNLSDKTGANRVDISLFLNEVLVIGNRSTRFLVL